MKHTTAGRNKDYKGPATYMDIKRAIIADAEKEKRNISLDHIDYILYSFFLEFWDVIKKTSLHLEGFGFFKKYDLIVTWKKSKLSLYKDRRRFQAKKNHLIRIEEAKKWYKKFMKFNQKRREIGHREWSWAHFCTVRRKTALIKYREYALKSRIKKF